MNPRCQKLSELDAKTAEMDKEWYAKRDSKTDEPAKIAKIYVTVYYAEKGEQKLHHFKKSMDIGNGHGGIVSQLKYNNEMKLTDELGTSTKANAVVKDAGKADRKPVQQKQAVDGKDKKLSIHERLEINKRIIQEKQGKDKPERGADFDVREELFLIK